jgi:outer membrane protein OmpA-like peptidoglycan-associated protein
MRFWLAIVLACGCGGGTVHLKEKKPLVVSAGAPAPPPEPKPEKVEVKQDRIEVKEIIQFETSSWKVTEESHAILDEIAKVMTAHPEVKKVRIEGHTDNEGDSAHNLSLSRKRANNIMKYLVEHGVDAARLVAEGYGDTKPVAPNDTEEGRAQNRRVVFVIVDKAAPKQEEDQ